MTTAEGNTMSVIERDDDVLPIYRRDLRRLTEQADQLAEDRIERNAEIARLRDQLAGAVEALAAAEDALARAANWITDPARHSQINAARDAALEALDRFGGPS